MGRLIVEEDPIKIWLNQLEASIARYRDSGSEILVDHRPASADDLADLKHAIREWEALARLDGSRENELRLLVAVN